MSHMLDVENFFISVVSLLSYISDELNRDYMLEHNEQKLKERRRRVYTFVKTPRELEKVFIFLLLLGVAIFTILNVAYIHIKALVTQKVVQHFISIETYMRSVCNK